MSSDSDVDEEIEELKPYVGKIRQDLKVAEALARASLLTPAGASARLAARRLQLGVSSDYMPPRDVLLYLVRLGSFQSTPKINNKDNQDNKLKLPKSMGHNDLMILASEERPKSLKLLNRTFLTNPTNLAEHFETLSLNQCVEKSPRTIRVLQWNVLSHTLGKTYERFVKCPPEVFHWDFRRYMMLEEIIRHKPDVICLQEVDHFVFLKTALGTQGYDGVFCPKPDSPCLYIEGNNGPDGCAVFFNEKKFTCIDIHTKILEVWKVKSNQVAIVVNLLIRSTGEEICVATTHLKAKRSALLAKLRDEQAKDLLSFIKAVNNNRPVILSGDFNGEPTEPFYKTMQNHKDMDLISAYAKYYQKLDNVDAADKLSSYEYPYTTWKIREDVEECHTIDYLFYSQNKLKVEGILGIPLEGDIGEGRLPCAGYPSDHFALSADFIIN